MEINSNLVCTLVSNEYRKTKHVIINLKTLTMKKVVLVLLMAITMVACGQSDDKIRITSGNKIVFEGTLTDVVENFSEYVKATKGQTAKEPVNFLYQPDSISAVNYMLQDVHQRETNPAYPYKNNMPCFSYTFVSTFCNVAQESAIMVAIKGSIFSVSFDLAQGLI